MKLRIRYKLLLGFALLVLLSSFIEAFTFTLLRDYISSQINTLLTDKAQTAGTEIDNFFTQTQKYTVTLARIYRQFGTGDNLTYTINNIITEDPYIRNVTILAPSGRELINISTQGKLAEDKLSFEVPTDTFINAKSGKGGISKVYYVNSDEGPHIDIFSPVFKDKETVAVVIKMEINLTKLWDIIAHIKLGENGYAYIVDNEGRLIAHPDHPYLLKRPNISNRNVIASILSNQDLHDNSYVNEKNIKVLAEAIKIESIGWVAAFEEPESEAYAFLNYIKTLFIITLFTSFFLLLLASILMSETLTHPIRKLREATQLIEAGNLNTFIDIKSGDEIETLADSFNAMTHRLLQREQLLKRERNEMEILLQSLTDGVIVVDKNLKILLFNNAAERITKLDHNNIIGMYIDEGFRVFDDDKKIPFEHYRWLTRELKTKHKQHVTYTLTPEGKHVVLSMRVASVLFQKQTHYGWIITFHDITREQELEEMKLDFVSMAAHELRTPLTAIRGYTSLLRDEYTDKLDTTGKSYINRLVISTKNLAGLIDNLLNVSRIERNTFKVALAPIDIVPIVKESITNLEEQAKAKKQTLSYQAEEHLPLVFADNSRIMQVMTNLLANAIAYTQENGEISVTVGRKGNFAEVSVKDNGQGISEKALPKIFTKFFRVSGVLEQGSKGTGLGLFITKSIIDLHNGEIHVESKEGQGSTFTFMLPISLNSATETKVVTPKVGVFTIRNRVGVIYNKDMYKKRFGKNLSEDMKGNA